MKLRLKYQWRINQINKIKRKSNNLLKIKLIYKNNLKNYYYKQMMEILNKSNLKLKSKHQNFQILVQKQVKI
jgi:hypothetical protein